MKILLSVFACAPNVGSETGGGWIYAIELAKNHEVWALTDISRRIAIESYTGHFPNNLHIIYYRPRVFAKLKLNSKTAHIIYQAWQMGAWRVAKALDDDNDFDLCWHLTYGVFRQPSWMWKVGKPFVFGPIGGGERAPMRLWAGLPISEKLREFTRDIINFFSWWLPGLRATYRYADLVIARTEDTKLILPDWVQYKTAVQQEIGGFPLPLNHDNFLGHQGHMNILFAGRLLGWKGVHLAIRAFSQFLQNGGLGHFTIVGEGPMAPTLQGLTASLGIVDKVKFIGKLPQVELFCIYPNFDVLLFPSLHDSGGNVVIESLSFGIPVICLDLGGPSSFVDETCGIIIPAHEASEIEVVNALEKALLKMFYEPLRHLDLCRAALLRAEALSWEKQIERNFVLIKKMLASNKLL
jgi:glycosyltransferase involved in cell wall biosynthesis